MTEGLVTFGQFRLDLRRRELSRDGARVPMGSRALDILCALASAHGEVVTKDQLMSQVWPDLTVSESNIHVHVAALRKALGVEKNGAAHVVNVPGRGYRLIGLDAPAPSKHDIRHATARPDRASIAVLPLDNLSGDDASRPITDGITEELTSALARIRWLFVVGRASTMKFKGQTLNLKQAGQELAVRYLLVGSLRTAGKKVRVGVELLDAETAAHLWSDHFDDDVEGPFDMQERIAGTIVGRITPRLSQAEIDRARRKTGELDGYDHCLLGVASTYLGTRAESEAALLSFARAIELEPDLAVTYAMAAWAYVWRRMNGWMTDSSVEIAEATRFARRAAHLGEYDAHALAFGGMALAYVGEDVTSGIAMVDRALTLNPHLAFGWCASGWLQNLIGQPEVALDHVSRAMRLSPIDPHMSLAQCVAALAHFLAGRPDEAAAAAELAVREQPTSLCALTIAAASEARRGRLAEARKAMVRACQLDPDLTLSNLRDRLGPLCANDFDKYAIALRQAGLTE